MFPSLPHAIWFITSCWPLLVIQQCSRPFCFMVQTMHNGTCHACTTKPPVADQWQRHSAIRHIRSCDGGPAGKPYTLCKTQPGTPSASQVATVGYSQAQQAAGAASRHSVRAGRTHKWLLCGRAGQDVQAASGGDFNQWVDEIKQQRPCFSIGGSFPFVANENANAAASEAAERCKASKTPPPPPPYTGWEAFWMERLGRPSMTSPPRLDP